MMGKKLLTSDMPKSLTREEARARLKAAGVLATNLGIPKNIRRPSDEAARRAGQLPPDAPSSEELVNEARGEY